MDVLGSATQSSKLEEMKKRDVVLQFCSRYYALLRCSYCTSLIPRSNGLVNTYRHEQVALSRVP